MGGYEQYLFTNIKIANITFSFGNAQFLMQVKVTWLQRIRKDEANNILSEYEHNLFININDTKIITQMHTPQRWRQ